MDNNVSKKRKKYKVISVPLLILNAIPSCLLALQNSADGGADDESVFFIACFCAWLVCFLITIIFSFVQCKWNGIWIGPVRFFLGSLIGALGAFALVIVLGMLIIMGMSGGKDSMETITIDYNGKYVPIYYDSKTGDYYSSELMERFKIYSSDSVRAGNGYLYKIVS